MKSSHTPGPWRVAELDSEPGAVEIRAGTFPNYIGAVAVLYDHNEKWADARLIAAAPDLLEALRSAIRGLDTDGHASAVAVLNTLGRAIIAKVEAS